MRKAGPPCPTDSLKESGRFDPTHSEPLGGPAWRPSHTSARSAGIPQRASTDSSRHTKHLLFLGALLQEFALSKSIAVPAEGRIALAAEMPHPPQGAYRRPLGELSPFLSLIRPSLP